MGYISHKTMMKVYLLLFLFVSVCSLVSGASERRLKKVITKNADDGAIVNRPANDYGNPNVMDGPWPECVGQRGEWCMDYISEWVGYSAFTSRSTARFQVVNIVPNYEYNPSRVWIHVDDHDTVMSAPEIG